MVQASILNRARQGAQYPPARGCPVLKGLTRYRVASAFTEGASGGDQGNDP